MGGSFMISVLLPVRNRPAHLKRSLTSLRDLAFERDYEVLIRLDDDDPSIEEEIEIAHSTVAKDRLVIVTDKRVGYWRLNECCNQLCKLAKGDFLLLWNDDMEILTPGWDVLLGTGHPFSVQELRRDTAVTADGTVPCVSRRVYETLGVYSHFYLNDLWISHVADGADVKEIRDDIVFKHHCLETVDRGSIAEQNKIGDELMVQYRSAEQVASRAAAVNAITTAMTTGR
jgi:glycosyltransferase involved in cell wall biosynthesis